MDLLHSVVSVMELETESTLSSLDSTLCGLSKEMKKNASDSLVG